MKSKIIRILTIILLMTGAAIHASAQEIIIVSGKILNKPEGKSKPEEIGKILDSGNRTAAGPTVPPGGLYMTHLWYDDGIEKFEAGSDWTV